MLLGDGEDEALVSRHHQSGGVEVPRAIQTTDLPSDTIPIPTPQSSVLGVVAQQPREIKHGRRAGGVVRFHENSWLFFNPVSYELVKPQAGLLRETPTADLELRAIQQRSSIVGLSEEAPPSSLAQLVPAPPPVVMSFTPLRARFMAPIGGVAASSGRPSPRLHIKAKMTEVPEGLRSSAPVLRVPLTATTPVLQQQQQQHEQQLESVVDVPGGGEIAKSQHFVPQVDPTRQQHHHHHRLSQRRVQTSRVDPQPTGMDTAEPPQPIPLGSFPEAQAVGAGGGGKGGIAAASEEEGSSKRSRTMEVDLEELMNALSIDFGGDLTSASGPTQFDVMQQLTLNCMRAIVRDVPFINDEHLPEEEDLNVVVNLRRQYLNLHPLTNMCVAESVPNELFNRVTKTASGVAVQLEHEGPVSSKAPAGPTRALDAVTIKTVGSAHQHSAPRDLPSRRALLEQLRAAQKRAEEYFGIYSTYTRIPPPLVEDVEFEVELKIDPGKLFTTTAQIVAPITLTGPKSTY